MSMTDLLTRLEEATCGYRELDCLIYAHRVNDRAVIEIFQNGDTEFLEGVVPRYTTSIDAALLLVPEGTKHWIVCTHEVKGYGAHVGPGFDNRANASTPALALCIAALRARAAHDTDVPL